MEITLTWPQIAAIVAVIAVVVFLLYLIRKRINDLDSVSRARSSQLQREIDGIYDRLESRRPRRKAAAPPPSEDSEDADNVDYTF